MRPRPSQQRDLFETERKASDIQSTQRARLVSLIERLLVEALADDGTATRADNDKTREVAHEQDHA